MMNTNTTIYWLFIYLFYSYEMHVFLENYTFFFQNFTFDFSKTINENWITKE